MFGTLSQRKEGLDKIEKACSSMKGVYPEYFEWVRAAGSRHL
jgi:hypothetical protein